MPYVWINIYIARQHCTRMLKDLAPPSESEQSSRQDQTWSRSWLRDKVKEVEEMSNFLHRKWLCVGAPSTWIKCYFMYDQSGRRWTERWQKRQLAQEITYFNSREGWEGFQKAYVTNKCSLEKQWALGWVVSTIYSSNNRYLRRGRRNKGWKLD